MIFWICLVTFAGPDGPLHPCNVHNLIQLVLQALQLWNSFYYGRLQSGFDHHQVCEMMTDNKQLCCLFSKMQAVDHTFSSLMIHDQVVLPLRLSEQAGILITFLVNVHCTAKVRVHFVQKSLLAVDLYKSYQYILHTPSFEWALWVQ